MTPSELRDAILDMHPGCDQPAGCNCSYCRLQKAAENGLADAEFAEFAMTYHHPAAAAIRDDGCECQHCSLRRLLARYEEERPRWRQMEMAL